MSEFFRNSFYPIILVRSTIEYGDDNAFFSATNLCFAYSLKVLLCRTPYDRRYHLSCNSDLSIIVGVVFRSADSTLLKHLLNQNLLMTFLWDFFDKRLY